MPDNNKNEFILPDIYSSDTFVAFANANFPTSEILSDKEIAKDYITNFLGKSVTSGKGEFNLLVLEEAIQFLPEVFKRKGMLANVDIRPLIGAFTDYVEKGNYLRDPKDMKFITGDINSRYETIAKEKIAIIAAQQGVALNDELLNIEVNKALNNSNGFSPIKYGENVDFKLKGEPTSTTPSDTTVTPTETNNQPTIDEEGNFVFDVNAVSGELGGLSYKQYLQRYATATIEDLLRLEDTGEVTTSEINAGEFVANLTGKVSGTNGTTPVMWSLAQAKEYLWSLDPNKVADLQDSLRDAGYFDKLGAYPYKGDKDEPTVLAWDLFLADALRNGQTPSARLQGASDAFAQRMASGQGNLFMDEEDVKGAALALGSKVLNRGLDQTELETLTAAVRNWEREAYKTKSTGQSETGDIFSEVDITARINSYMQETYNEETVINSLPENIKFLKSVFG
jgi:hypothetical protein